MNKLLSTKNRVFISLVGPSRRRKSQFIYNWLRIGTCPPKNNKTSFFNKTRSHFTMLCKKNRDNLEFVQCVYFEFLHSLKNNGTKFSLTFYDFCEEYCNSKAFVDFATAGRQSGLSTIYN